MPHLGRYSKPNFPSSDQRAKNTRHGQDQLVDGKQSIFPRKSFTKRKRKDSSSPVYTTIRKSADSFSDFNIYYLTKSQPGHQHHEIISSPLSSANRGSRNPSKTPIDIDSGRKDVGMLDKDRRLQLLKSWDWTGIDILRPLKLQRTIATDNESLGKRRRVSDDTGKRECTAQPSWRPEKLIVERRNPEKASPISLREERIYDEDSEISLGLNSLKQSTVLTDHQHSQAVDEERSMLDLSSNIDGLSSGEEVSIVCTSIRRNTMPSVRTCRVPLQHPAPRSSQSENLLNSLLRSESSIGVPMSGSSPEHATQRPQQCGIDYSQAFWTKPRRPVPVKAKPMDAEDAWKNFVFSDVGDE